MKTIRLSFFAFMLICVGGCATAPRKPATETAKAEKAPVVDPFAPVTSETAEYWKKRNADDRTADEWDRAQQQMNGKGSP